MRHTPVAKEAKAEGVAAGPPEQYGDVVQRLEAVVAQLEGGTLSLEDSLKAFEEGIRLVRRGEHLLSSAEKRIEELLAEDGQDVVAPLQHTARPPSAAAPRKPSAAGGPPEEDVPF
jgi:exodeoxyribonuclease VII small subunit